MFRLTIAPESPTAPVADVEGALRVDEALELNVAGDRERPIDDEPPAPDATWIGGRPRVDRQGREIGWQAAAADRVDDDDAVGHPVARAEAHGALQVGAAGLGECPERVQVRVAQAELVEHLARSVRDDVTGCGGMTPQAASVMRLCAVPSPA